jgi:hypothetical protein
MAHSVGVPVPRLERNVWESTQLLATLETLTPTFTLTLVIQFLFIYELMKDPELRVLVEAAAIVVFIVAVAVGHGGCGCGKRMYYKFFNGSKILAEPDAKKRVWRLQLGRNSRRPFQINIQ